jgi:hypothetical protein
VTGKNIPPYNCVINGVFSALITLFPSGNRFVFEFCVIYCVNKINFRFFVYVVKLKFSGSLPYRTICK